MKNFTRCLRQAALLAAFSSTAVFAQDATGNGLLKGSFRFRYVGAVSTSATGVVTETTSSFGVISFLGNGTYTISAGSQWNDNTVSNGAFQTIPTGSGGTYSINSAGIGTISNPNPNPGLTGDTMVGTFTQGVFTASSTEFGVTDLLVVMAVGPIPTNATFTSPYWIGALDFAIGTDTDLKNALFKINPNGSGGLGALTVNGWANSTSGNPLTQNVSGATYNFASDGNAQFSIPAPTGVATPQVLVSGSRTMYVSADGNFMLGWTPNGYDILFGVKALPSSVSDTDSQYTGLYYLAGMGDQPTVSGNENCGPFGYWGSEKADGAENEVVHQRLFWPTCANYTDSSGFPLSYDFGTWNETGVKPDGSATDLPLGFLYPGGSQYGFGDTGGNCESSVSNATCAFVAISNTPGTMGLSIGIHAPTFTASGLFLNPLGVVHAASWQPITASVAPGELLTLFGSFGSNIPSTGYISTGGQPFPNTLGPVQVYINGVQAPIYYVFPNQIAVIAPYELASASTYTATIQVNNGGLLSNSVSVFLLTDANSGVFAASQNGIGAAVAEHSNGSLITSSSPAQPGETIVLALAGMGTVTPSITDGAVPSTTTLSYVDDFTNQNLMVYFQDYDNGQYFENATVAFAGLYPGLASLYQMNVTVPTTVGPGNDIYVEVVTPYADDVQVSVPVGGTANASATKSVRLHQSGGPIGSAAFGQHEAPVVHRPKPQVVPVRRKLGRPVAAPVPAN